MTTAAEHDPYLLPMPGPHSPVVGPDLVKPIHAHLNSRYRDPIWSLAPLTENPSAERTKIHWRNFPVAFHAELRLAVWNLINGELRPTFLRSRGSSMRTRIGVMMIATTVQHWLYLTKWLDNRGIHTLSGCDTPTFDGYARHLLATNPLTRSSALRRLIALTRLWALDQISSAPTGIGQPPWETTGIDDYLPDPTPTGGENATAPLAEDTVGPLLVWAIRMVDDLADDILNAHAEYQRLNKAIPTASQPAGRHALRVYLDALLQSRGALPVFRQHDRVMLAWGYICGRTGATTNQLQEYPRRAQLLAAATQRPCGCPLDIPVTGRIAGKPWREVIDYREVWTLWRHLGTAAFITCAYLTGMRPGEKRAELRLMQHSATAAND